MLFKSLHLNLFYNITFPVEKLMPPNLSALPSPVLDLEDIRSRKMSRRAKVIKELVQTEKDYLTDLELCIREVVQPLRVEQVGES